MMTDNLNKQESAFLGWGMVPLRVVVGLVFLMHGGQKVFVFGLDGTADIMGKLGLPLPMLAATVVMAAEVLGGLAIISGLFARWAGAALAIEMLVAIPVARLHGGFFTPYGYELELTLLGACLTLAAVGSGGASLDRMLRRARE
jgi:putative oxidoreductase